MTLKTYQAATMAEALAEVKRDLGREAVILHTRTLRKGGLLGLLGGRSVWEVTASQNVNVPSRLFSAGAEHAARGRYVSHTAQASEGESFLPAASERAGKTPIQTQRGGDEDGSLENAEKDLPNFADVQDEFIPLGDADDESISENGVEAEKHVLFDENDAEDTLARWPNREVRESAWRVQVGLERPKNARRRGPEAEDEVPQAAAALAELANQGPVQTPAEALHAGVVDPVLTREVFDIKRMVETLVQIAPAAKSPAIPSELVEFHTHMLKQDVSEEIANDLIEQLRLSLAGTESYDAKTIADRLCDLIASRITIAPPAPIEPAVNGKPRVIALIGPTGVGKTTTVAKMAANFKLRQNLRVGLVTIDTYRIAAVDQLRTYAEIIEVPLRTVMSPGELHKAVFGMPDVDVVLMDSIGRSPNDQARLKQLQEFLAAGNADEVHLVISATSGWKSAKAILERFGSLGANRMILTKLDEAETFGTILSFAAEQAPPLSFVTTGQDVPDDIETADPWQLAQRILKGKKHA